MRKLSLIVAVVIASALFGCSSTARVQYQLPELNTVGDFLPVISDRVILNGRLSYILPEGWVDSGYENNEVLVLTSPEVRDATVRIQEVSRSDIPRMRERPENCQHFYAYCTPIQSALTTHYGVVRWKQTVYIDNGHSGVFRLDMVFGGGTTGRGVPVIVGAVASSLTRVDR